MGKGDKKTKRGKIIKGSFGNSRLKRKLFGINDTQFTTSSKATLNSETDPDL